MTTEYQNLIKQGYLNEQGVLKVPFIDQQAKSLADEFNRCMPALSTKQARSIFNIINGIYVKMTTQRISFDEAKMQLVMLKSRINDKVSKGNLSKEFQSFYDLNVTCINTPQDLIAFRLHFEAICNYLKDSKPQDKNSSFKPRDDRGFNRNNNNNKSYTAHR